MSKTKSKIIQYFGGYTQKRKNNVTYSQGQCKNNSVFFNGESCILQGVNGLTRSTTRCRKRPFTIADVLFAGNRNGTPISNYTIA